jgi:hypothetical protein
MRLLIFVLVTLVTLSTVKTSGEKAPMNKLNFYNYTHLKLAEFVAEQQNIALILQQANELRSKLKEERAKEIYRQRLASQIKSSFIRDFITTRY